MIYPSVPQVDDSLDMSERFSQSQNSGTCNLHNGERCLRLAHMQQQHAIVLRSRPETKPEDQSPTGSHFLSRFSNHAGLSEAFGSQMQSVSECYQIHSF